MFVTVEGTDFDFAFLTMEADLGHTIIFSITLICAFQKHTPK